MSGLHYTPTVDGRLYRLRSKLWRIACCDCGLCHDLRFEVCKGILYVVATRNQRATAARRRRKTR